MALFQPALHQSIKSTNPYNALNYTRLCSARLDYTIPNYVLICIRILVVGSLPKWFPNQKSIYISANNHAPIIDISTHPSETHILYFYWMLRIRNQLRGATYLIYLCFLCVMAHYIPGMLTCVVYCAPACMLHHLWRAWESCKYDVYTQIHIVRCIVIAE